MAGKNQQSDAHSALKAMASRGLHLLLRRLHATGLSQHCVLKHSRPGLSQASAQDNHCGY